MAIPANRLQMVWRFCVACIAGRNCKRQTNQERREALREERNIVRYGGRGTFMDRYWGRFEVSRNKEVRFGRWSIWERD